MLFVYPPQTLDKTGLATETKQDTIIAEIQDVEAELTSANATLTSLDGKDFATQTTLNALNSKDFATQTTLASVLSDTNTIAATDFATQTTLAALNAKVTAVDTSALATQATLAAQAADVASLEAKDFATQTTLAAQAADIGLLEDRLAGSLVPEAYDFIQTTYVTVGNGIGEIETVTFKTGGSGGTTVATLTLTYDANDKLSTVTRS